MRFVGERRTSTTARSAASPRCRRAGSPGSWRATRSPSSTRPTPPAATRSPRSAARPPLGVLAFDCIARRGILGDEGIDARSTRDRQARRRRAGGRLLHLRRDRAHARRQRLPQPDARRAGGRLRRDVSDGRELVDPTARRVPGRASRRSRTRPAAIRTAVERAAEALEAEVGALVRDGEVVAAVGFPLGCVSRVERSARGRERSALARDPRWHGPAVTIAAQLGDERRRDASCSRALGDEASAPRRSSSLRGMARVLAPHAADAARARGRARAGASCSRTRSPRAAAAATARADDGDPAADLAPRAAAARCSTRSSTAAAELLGGEVVGAAHDRRPTIPDDSSWSPRRGAPSGARRARSSAAASARASAAGRSPRRG